MATNYFYITAGLPPDDNGADSGTNYFYITAGLVPDDTAVAAGGGSIGRWLHNTWEILPTEE